MIHESPGPQCTWIGFSYDLNSPMNIRHRTRGTVVNRNMVLNKWQMPCNSIYFCIKKVTDEDRDWWQSLSFKWPYIWKRAACLIHGTFLYTSNVSVRYCQFSKLEIISSVPFTENSLQKLLSSILIQCTNLRVYFDFVIFKFVLRVFWFSCAL